MKSSSTLTGAFRALSPCLPCKKKQLHSFWKDESAGVETLAAYFSLCQICSQIEQVEKNTYESLKGELNHE